MRDTSALRGRNVPVPKDELLTYEEVVEQVRNSQSLGADFELREVKRWTVHCAHCGTQMIGDTPQTEKTMQQLKRLVNGRECRNANCVSRGGAERRRTR